MTRSIKSTSEELIDKLRLFASPVFGRISPKDVAICTIHGNSDAYTGHYAIKYSWPKLQITQLRKHTPPGYKIYAYGNNIIPEHEEFLKECEEVVYTSSKGIKNGVFDHVWPLRNWLTRKALKNHKIIIHLDSDALPVCDNWLEKYSQSLCLRSPVVAVKRLENGDTHSDRCFLMFSKEGFQKHAFDFSTIDAKDAGGGISRDLESHNYHWKALLRSNKHNYHKVISAIYDDCIYHHGAGTRQPRLRQNLNKQQHPKLWSREINLHRLLMMRLFDHTNVFLNELRGKAPPFDIEAAINS